MSTEAIGPDCTALRGWPAPGFHAPGSPAYVHTNVRTYVHTYVRAYKHTHIHTYKHTNIQTYKHTNIHTNIQTYIQTYKYACMHTYMHTCIHAYVRTYIHTYIPLLCRPGATTPALAPRRRLLPSCVAQLARKRSDLPGGITCLTLVTTSLIHVFFKSGE